MKKQLLFSGLLGLLVFLSCKNDRQEHSLYGNWKVRFKSGPAAEARFHKDSTHDYYVEGKLFSSGRSVFQNDTLRTFDPICQDKGEYFGIYKVDFLGGDSVRFVVVSDSCAPRRYDMDGAVLHRLDTRH
jgi:hypothetical protein